MTIHRKGKLESLICLTCPNRVNFKKEINTQQDTLLLTALLRMQPPSVNSEIMDSPLKPMQNSVCKHNTTMVMFHSVQYTTKTCTEFLWWSTMIHYHSSFSLVNHMGSNFMKGCGESSKRKFLCICNEARLCLIPFLWQVTPMICIDMEVKCTCRTKKE